ncbi:uncharacterized protein LOC116245933 isoform X1 [Nymphaea colorata]|nr:uncharacterized protein LOC116245933 isoform X1 [Nymphaea colorata]
MLLGRSRFFFPLKKNQPLLEGSPDSSGVALPPTRNRFSLRVYPSILLVRTLNPFQARAGICRRNGSGRISKLGKKDWEEKEEEEENKGVHCEVEVISWRERRIKASITVEEDEEAVWKVLTDYEKLADFVPNLVCSERIPCPHPGRIWVMQKGMQRALYWHIEARVVLDLQELSSAEAGKELYFRMVDGDFMKFEGKWSLKAGVRSSTTILSYELNVIPRFNYPAIFIERIIRSDLPVNLQAIASQAEKRCGVSKTKVIDESILDKNFKVPIVSHQIPGLPSSENSEPSSSDSRSNHTTRSLDPLLPPPSEESNSSWSVYGKVCRLDRICMADEVHFRRCDDLLENGGVHRSVAACITVKASVHRVWSVLTDYETLPEFVPNLAISKVLYREKNKARILQEGCKGLLYMVLHARVVLDLHEQFEQEIAFEQVEGDFDSFQGKWILEQLGNQHTLLKYVVESKMQKNSFLSEAIVEEVIYEDLPSNLCAIRDRIEECDPSSINSRIDGHDKFSKTQVYPDGSTFQVKVTNDVQIFRNDRQRRIQRPKIPGLQRNIEILESELRKYIAEHGQEGLMPMRKQLRLDGRVDLEKAITRMGGFRHIASLMNLSLAYKHRKPKGYWDSLDNLHEEIVRFQRSWGMDPSFMPSKKSFERAGRYDLARALEKWGGLQEVSRLLSLKLRHPRGVTASKQKRNDSIVDQASSSPGRKCKAFVSQDTQKWLMTLKHLGINWVE